MAQAFRTQNLRLLGNLFDKNNSLGAKGYSLFSTGDGTAWQADQNDTSGILVGGVLSIGAGSNTISITAGNGQIFTRALVGSEIVTTLTNVSWNAFTNISLNYLATKQFSYLYIDQTGALVQSDVVFSDSIFKNYIVIGIVIHLNNTTINAVINAQNAGYGDSHRLYELYSTFGPIKRSGLSISSNGANLKINRSAGSVLLIGCNYTTDQFEPDTATLTSYLDVKFARVRANGSGGHTFDNNSGTLYTAIDPNNYDNGSGTLAAVTSGYWTIQRFYLFSSQPDRLVNYYGVATYATLSDALIALPNENFTESSFTARDSVFLGYVIVKQGVTDLSISANAKFLQAGLSRSLSSSSASGGGTSTVATLDDLTDVQITTPLGGQFLTYDSGSSLWKNRSYILDANNNELIKFPSTVTSAVNELTISNAATTGSPSISATGDDTNIGLNLISKGTGLVQINGKAISLANSFTTSGNFALTFTTTATTSLTLPTSGTLATTSQIPTVYDNTLTLAGSGGISLSGTPTFTANASADKTITISIADGALAISKLADITTLRILGRTSASTGPVEQLDGTGVVAVIGSSAVSRAVNLGGGIAGQIPYQSGANTTAFSAAGTANQVLLSGGSGAPTWANQSSLSVGSATTAGSVANALTISSPLTGTSYNGSAAISIGLQEASATQAGGVSIGAQTFAGNKTFKDNVIVSGNLTVNGSTVTINSSTLSVDDKNIELGAVVAIASLSSTVNIDAGDTNVIVSSTSGLIVGQALTKISGTGNFGTNPIITSITSATQFTVSPVHATTGSIVFSVGGATDVTADGGGITLKGTTDKTILWVDSTDAWTLSEHLNIASGKSYRINGTDVLNSTTLGPGVVNSSLTSVGTLTNLTVTNTITGSVSGSAGSLSGTYTFWGQSFNGTQNVSGNLTSVGNITGSGGITITAGGSNQNVVLTPSGTGYTLLNGSVGIGNSTPNNKLTIQAGDNKDSGPIINLGGNAINQFESGRIRFTEVVTGAAPFYQGAYLHYDGSNNLFHIGVHDSADSLIASDTNAISIVRSNGNVGIGTTNPVWKLDVSGSGVRSFATGAVEPGFIVDYDSTNGYGGFFLHTNGTRKWRIGNVGDTSSNPALFIWQEGVGARMYFKNDGLIGIGTTSPAGKLDVYENSNAGHTSIVRNVNAGSSAYSAFFLGNNEGNNKLVMFTNSSTRTGDGGAGNSTIRTDSGKLYLGAGATQHILDTTGNVGIGNTSPNNKLAVSGSASIGSNYNIAAPTNGLIVEGNVGIGISSPLSKLHLVGSHVSGSGFIRLEASDYPIISLKAPATGDGSAGYWGVRAQDTSNNDLMFYGYRYTSAFSGFWIDPDFGSNIAKGFFVKRSDGNVGIGINTPSARLHANSITSGATLIRADGTNGTLFSVVDDLSDSLMSVNNSAGLPVLEVFADDRIVAGQYGQNDLVVINNKVGVGTANPINKLSVIGAANIGDSTYNVSAPTNGLIVQGDVGIGTVSPTAQSNYRFLQVNGTNSAVIETMVGGVRIGGFDSTSSILYVGTIGAFPIVFRTGVNEKWRITNAGIFQSSGAQTIQTDTGILTLATAAGNGHIVLSPHGTGNVGVGTATPAYKLDVIGGNISTDNEIYALGGRLSLYRSAGSSYIDWSNGQNLIFRTETSVGGAGASEKMRIQSDGNVGIGTTTPSSKLHISNAAAATRITITDDIVNGRSGYIESNYSDALVIGTTSGVRSIKFAPDNSIAMTIQVATNNVGIGTVTPGYKLDVNGTARIANDTLTTGNLTISKSGANLYINGINSDAEVHWQANGTSRWAMGMNVGDATENLNIYNYTTATTNFTILKVDGNVGIGIAAPTNKIDVNGTARIRSISASASAATIFLTTDANGVLVSRTAAQVRSDIGAGTGNGTVTSVTGSGGLASSGGTTPDISIATDGVTTVKILNSNVTLAKIQNVAISSVLGNSSPSAAQAPVEINMTTLATMLSGKTMDIVGNATNVTGVVAIANGGTGTATTTANAFFVGPNGSSGAPSFRVMATADIPASIITFAKIQDVAGPTLIGRISATAGPVAALSSANARTAIGATTVGSNLITLPDISVSDKFLRVNFADNTVSALDAAAFRTAIGAGTGNGTVTSVSGTAPIASSGGTTPVISLNDAGVTYAKIQNVTAGSVLGRLSGVGSVQELDGSNIASIISTNYVQNANNATNATNSTNVNITTDDATNSSYYLYFGANASGNTALKASTKIRYNPNSGAFSATTKSFRIPHPTKPQHDLVYGSLESPYHGIRLTGKGKTSGNRAEIILPDYVKVLIDEETINIQLTVIKCAKILYIDDIFINDNKFTVKYDKSWYEKSKDVEFYWDFTAERKDVPKLIVEEKI